MLKALTQALNAPVYHESFSALNVQMKKGPRWLQQKELWLSREVSRGGLQTSHLGLGAPRHHPPWLPAAFVVRVSFLRLTGLCPGINTPLPSRANVTEGNYTSTRKMLVGWSGSPVCSVKSNCFSETASLEEDWNHPDRLILKFW